MSAVIVEYLRSPFTPARKGGLSRMRPDDVASIVVRELIERTGINPELIEDVIIGCAFPEGEQGFNLARMITFLSDLPNSLGGVTINRFCGSSMQAIHDATGRIAMGAGEAFICGGVESMTRIPMTGFNPMPNPKLADDYPEAFTSMGITAENLAEQRGISRERQEAFAIESHRKAANAQETGALVSEIVAIQTGEGLVEMDGCIRADTDPETLAGLRPAFDENGTVTAGTSSPLTDGVAFVLVCSEAFAERNGLNPLARIRSTAISGCDPDVMGIGPVGASRKALERAGMELSDIDIVELNEAFSAQSIAVIEELELDADKVNLDGGAIALGHPLGASGARITGKAAQLLQRNGAKTALVTMCIGGGQGIATVLERVD
ncbi:MAG TPA: thiolase family protein [Candidatus Thalassarchaeaceae archaeon]|jgi:acetyl-CoA acyltransferase|nr:acetyl-CoA C-acyltransferase [Euryarchaeota archaeon]MDP6378180.1 thiolase family protein [Candidatus Thalassarchaeaceae archaeon]DAC50293.1 MAG TPA: thiolase family protein [Candidatus Poseidoniales archaeon]MDP6742502.1 thiolase family protein [Candidatus Thalassarchaeaceae archaeon]MDP7043805.1 thiolase family protein [Candidatus Thalassarchaeaceae archaeon]|tara:strand:- start:932 stop:2068 length:1137 start_codon:yes stop_codon:yes gene_type:complete